LSTTVEQQTIAGYTRPQTLPGVSIRAKAPLRISFGGGGTDVSPYPEEKGGAVLSATIDKYTYCSLAARQSSFTSVYSLDYDLSGRYSPDEKLRYDGELGLVKAAIKVMGNSEGIDLFLHSDAPPGSGLGTSSAMTVAIVGAFNRLLKTPLTEYATAELAYRIERQEAGIKGGRQDQYAASFGGFNFIEFLGNTTVVNPLRIKTEIVNELQYRLLLCYTGRTRLSAGIIDDQVSGYIQKKENVTLALDRTKALAVEMKNQLLLGHIDEFGSLMHEAWESKKMFSDRITDSHIDALYEAARRNGALGGKLLGAGGGGYLLVLSEFDKWHIIARRLEELGGTVVKFAFSPVGLQTWELNGD
jgi:D-glycero-alpha-D-manno-heptose-7-phosphate kinase